MNVTPKRWRTVGSATAIVVALLAAVLLYRGHLTQQVLGELTSKDVQHIRRMTWSRRTQDRSNPRAILTIRSFRGAIAKMEVMERPAVLPEMTYVVYRDRFNNKSNVYYFKTDGTNGWKFSGSSESW